MTQTILIGRGAECDYLVYDPLNRVSRKHALLIKEVNQLFIQDLGSSNGTYLNGRQIKPNIKVPITAEHKLTLSKDFELDFLKIKFPDLTNSHGTGFQEDDDKTLLFNQSSLQLNSGGKTILFDRDNAKLEDLAKHEVNVFKTIGRDVSCHIRLDQGVVSKLHAKLRLLTPVIFEIEDLNSTNGTFVDGEKLTANKRYQFSSSAQVRLGNNIPLALKNYFPELVVLEKKFIPSPAKSPQPQPMPAPASSSTPTAAEVNQFKELENVWKEYNNRLNQATSAATGFGIGGAVFGLAAAAFTGATGGIGGILLMSGGGILGRYLGQKESNKIRGDLTFEDAFLEVYACPRCKESFQKKPWVTIRECFRCKTKYR
jgi:pSer/pThr/pTyr-binding forkhead associated (FHA) protein